MLYGCCLHVCQSLHLTLNSTYNMHGKAVDMSIADVNAWIICHPHLMHTSLSLFIVFAPPPPFLLAHTYTHAHNTHDYTQSGETALHDAVNQGHEDTVDILLEANIDPNVADKVSHMTLTVPNMKYHLLHTASTCAHWLIMMFFMMKIVQLEGCLYC